MKHFDGARPTDDDVKRSSVSREGKGASQSPQPDRRRFLKTAAALGLGGAGSYIVPQVSRGQGGADLSPAWPLLQPIPGGNSTALDMLYSSESAQVLAAWIGANYPSLVLESSRALLFLNPAVGDLPPGVGLEDRPSLLGESAYAAFLNDDASQSMFTEAQRTLLGAPDRMLLARDIGRLVGLGGPMVCASCCCCCCCCSLCCCSCNNGDQGGQDPDAKLAACLPYGDPSVQPSDPTVVSYYRGVLVVQENGESWVLVQHVSNDEDMTFLEGTVAVGVSPETMQAFVFDPLELEASGPDKFANELFETAYCIP